MKARLMGLTACFFQFLFTSRIHRSLGAGFAIRVLSHLQELIEITRKRMNAALSQEANDDADDMSNYSHEHKKRRTSLDL